MLSLQGSAVSFERRLLFDVVVARRLCWRWREGYRRAVRATDDCCFEGALARRPRPRQRRRWDFDSLLGFAVIVFTCLHRGLADLG